MVVQQEAIGRADPNHILNTENNLNQSLLTKETSFFSSGTPEIAC